MSEEAIESVESVDSVETTEVVESNEVLEASGEEGSDSVEVQASTESELEQEIQEAVEEGATDDDIKNMIRQFTIKVNGKEIVKEIDLSDEESVRKELQMAYAGRQAMQESAELKKLYASEIDRLISDPFTVLKELNPGLDPLELSAKYIEKHLKEQEMSPEEKEAIQQKSEYEKIKAEHEELKKQLADQQRSESMAKVEKQIETDILDALDSDAELVADRDTIALVAENLLWAEKNGITDLTALDVLPTVKKQLRKQFQSAASRFKSTAALKQYMGDELLGKLREERVEQMKKQVKTVSNVKQSASKQKNNDKKVEKINLSSLFK